MKILIGDMEPEQISNINNEIECGSLSGATLSERELVETVFDSFENKYISPFMLYSLGYKYEDIALSLQLPTNVVRSRIFYVQKRMQMILMDKGVVNKSVNF